MLYKLWLNRKNLISGETQSTIQRNLSFKIMLKDLECEEYLRNNGQPKMIFLIKRAKN